MRNWRVSNAAPVHLAILRSASWIVPSQQRVDWFAEWSSELWYVRQASNRHSRTQSFSQRHATSFCLGAFHDAFWLWRNQPRSSARPGFRFGSPLHCVAFLAALTIASVTCCLLPGAHAIIGQTLSGGAREHSLINFLLQLIMACFVLPATTSLSLGEYPAESSSAIYMTRLRQGAFLATKLSLVLLIVYCGSCGLAQGCGWIARSEEWWSICKAIEDRLMPIQPLACFAGCLFGIRWTLRDQRQRCPVCLNLLTNPAPVGQPSRNFLAWSGTELICAGGHGLLHVPETPTSWFSTQRWLSLDPSWRVLFL